MREVSRIKSIKIRRSRCLVHILRELGNKIDKSKQKDELINVKDLATVMFFPSEKNIEIMKKDFIIFLIVNICICLMRGRVYLVIICLLNTISAKPNPVADSKE